MTEVTDSKFMTFVADKAALLQTAFGGTPMRLFREDHRSGNREIYARTLDARSPTGETSEMIPHLSSPADSETYGVLSAIHAGGLFVEELMTSREGFKFLMVSHGGVDTNRSDTKSLLSEMRDRTLPLQVHVCEARAINNSTKWGIGFYAYGNLLGGISRNRISEALVHRRTCWQDDPTLEGCADAICA